MMWPLPCRRIPGSTARVMAARAKIVGFKHGANLGVFAFLDRGQVAKSGVVHQHVDAAKVALSLLHGFGNLRRVSDIQLEHKRPAVVGCAEILERIRIARRYHGAPSFLKHNFRQFPAKPSGTARDKPYRCVLIRHFHHLPNGKSTPLILP